MTQQRVQGPQRQPVLGIWQAYATGICMVIFSFLRGCQNELEVGLSEQVDDTIDINRNHNSIRNKQLFSCEGTSTLSILTPLSRKDNGNLFKNSEIIRRICMFLRRSNSILFNSPPFGIENPMSKGFLKNTLLTKIVKITKTCITYT